MNSIKLLKNFLHLNIVRRRGISGTKMLYGVSHLKSVLSVPQKHNQFLWIVDRKLSNNSDVARAFTCFKYLRLIKARVREGGPVLEENEKLVSVIERAKKLNMPSGFIEFAMKISINARATAGVFEMQLPGSCHFIIQYEDIDQTTTKHHLLEMCEETDGTLIQGEVKWPLFFDHKGILSVKVGSGSPFSNIEEANAFALKNHAETVKEIDEEGFECWKFYCNPSALHEVKKCLIKEGCDIEEAYVGYIPKVKVTPSNHQKTVINNIIVDLNKIPT
ncbi:Translational activator of cytochrome c oxidase 1, partial [Stegodyphus mimosarum]